MPGIKTLRAMSSALKNREISSTELTQEHLAKIAADKTNSFVTVAKDNALEQAKQALDDYLALRPNLKTREDFKKIFVPNSALGDILIEGLIKAGWEPEGG